MVLMNYNRSLVQGFAFMSVIVTAANLPLYLMSSVALAVLAWRGRRPLSRDLLALGLFGAVLIACVATYLHHATDTLKLSF